MNKLTLVHTTNNAYDMILLVEDEKVIGAWDYSETEFDTAKSELLDLWAPNFPDEESIEDYGEIVETK